MASLWHLAPGLTDDVAEGAVLRGACDTDEQLAAAAVAESGAYVPKYVLKRGVKTGMDYFWQNEKGRAGLLHFWRQIRNFQYIV